MAGATSGALLLEAFHHGLQVRPPFRFRLA
jgi:hypothetical protein